MVYSFRLFWPMSRPIGARSSIISPIFCVCYWIAMRKLGKWRVDWRCGFPFLIISFGPFSLEKKKRNGSGRSCLSCKDWPPGRSARKLFFSPFAPLSAQSVCSYSGGRNLRRLKRVGVAELYLKESRKIFSRRSRWNEGRFAATSAD